MGLGLPVWLVTESPSVRPMCLGPPMCLVTDVWPMCLGRSVRLVTT